MKHYVVVYEARKAGAIGAFSKYRSEVHAEDHDLAADKARQNAYASGLEHVHVRSVEVATEDDE